jgi:hypothetical protein
MENTIENREKLAERMLDSADLEAILQFYYEAQLEYLDTIDNEEFNELWDQYLE